MSNEVVESGKPLQQIVQYFEDRGVVDMFAQNTTYSREVITQRALEFVLKLNQQDFDNKNNSNYAPLAQCSGLSKQQTFLKILSLNLPADYRSFYYLYNKNGTMVFEISYKGMLLLAERAGFSCDCELVYEGDEFEIKQSSQGDYYSLNRKNVFENGKIVGAFVSSEFSGKTKIYTYTFTELETSRKKSKAANSPAWKDFAVDMYKKCALRKALNIILSKTDVVLARQIMEDETEPELQSTKTAELDINDKQSKFNELKNQFGVTIDVDARTEEETSGN